MVSEQQKQKHNGVSSDAGPEQDAVAVVKMISREPAGNSDIYLQIYRLKLQQNQISFYIFSVS